MKLKAGEIKCPQCNGLGYFIKRKSVSKRVCDKCWGEGKLDWIEHVIGKQHPWTSPFINLPNIKASYPQLIAKDIVSVQPIEVKNETKSG